MRHLADFMEFVEDRLEMMERETASWLLEVDRRAAMRMSVLSVRPPPIASNGSAIGPSTPPAREKSEVVSQRMPFDRPFGVTRSSGTPKSRGQVLKPKLFQSSLANDSFACRTKEFQ